MDGLSGTRLMLSGPAKTLLACKRAKAKRAWCAHVTSVYNFLSDCMGIHEAGYAVSTT